MVPEQLRDFIVTTGSPKDLEILDRGGTRIDNGQWVLDVVQRYTAWYLDMPENVQAHPEWNLDHEQKRKLIDWLTEVAPNGIREYRERCREEDKFLRGSEKMESKIQRLFPEAYNVIFNDS